MKQTCIVIIYMTKEIYTIIFGCFDGGKSEISLVFLFVVERTSVKNLLSKNILFWDVANILSVKCMVCWA